MPHVLMPGRFHSVILTFVVSAFGLLGGCVDKPALSPIPRELVDAALVPDCQAIRQWGDAPGPLGKAATISSMPPCCAQLLPSIARETDERPDPAAQLECTDAPLTLVGVLG